MRLSLRREGLPVLILSLELACIKLVLTGAEIPTGKPE
jgi:hypothetical protein